MSCTLLVSAARRPHHGYTRRGGRVKLRALRLAVIAALAWACVAADARAEEPDDASVFLNRIILVGNSEVPTDELRARMRTREPSTLSIIRRPRLDRAQIQRDIAQLEAYYHAIGYPDATVRLERIDYLENDRFADIVIRIHEGQAIRVREVLFTGTLLIDEKELREGLLLQPGAAYNASLLSTDVFKVKGKYFDRGHFAVMVDDSVRIDERRVTIRFHIDPGPQLSIGKVTIEGNKLVRTGVVENEITFESGQVCRYGELIKTQRNLFETGLFTTVDVLPENLDTARQTVDIRVRVRERKTSWVEVGFGVGSILGSRVFGEWGTRNLAGTGRTLRFKAQYAFDLFSGDDLDVQEFDVTTTFYRYDAVYSQRRVFGIKLGFGVNAYLEKDATVPDIEVKTIGTAVGVSHDFSEFTRLLAAFSVENIRRREYTLPEVKSTSHILGSALSRDTRDFILNPRSGEYRFVSADVAGGILGGDNEFYTATGNYQRYHLLGRKTVLAWRARVGFADAYGSSAEVPVENRFFLGGGNSVRGYGESSLGPRYIDTGGVSRVNGGEFMALANVELRFSLPFLAKWNFDGAFFLDSGNVWAGAHDVQWNDFRFVTKSDETTFDDYRYGVGVGVRYNTPIGPIRVDFGYPTKPDVYTDLHGSFYFSLGQIF
jgi:outer membrane protein insertion porin family